jgi:hypothetical protein
MQIIPFTSDYDQSVVVQLGEKKYQLAARWNEMGKSWTGDLVRDEDQELLLAGIPLLIGQDLLAPYALGIGGLVVTDLSAKGTDAGPDDFGDRVIATWLSTQELSDIAAALMGIGEPSIVVPGAPPGGGQIGGQQGSAGQPGSGSTGGTTTINVSQTVNNITVEGGAGGFGGDIRGESDQSGDEVLVGVYVQNTAANLGPTASLAAGFTAAGSGKVRFYVGGTVEAVGFVGTPSGAQVGSDVTVSGAMAPYWATGSTTNPAGVTLVKVTIQSAAPATEITLGTLNGVFA